jgi:hypothetical protein
MIITDQLRAYYIDLPDTRPGQHETICPQCTASRKKEHQNQKKLGVKIDATGAVWHCHHCGWSGALSKGRKYDAVYDYRDADHTLLWQKLKNSPGSPNKFTQRRPNGHGEWVWEGVRKDLPSVLYRLPEVNEAIKAGKEIIIVEGEKDADNMWKLGIPATCNPDGAAGAGVKPKWRVEHSEQLRGADIVIMGDHDTPGYAHQEVTARLSVGIARRVRTLRLADHWPECPEGGDVSDWLKAGHTKEELLALLTGAPKYVPSEDLGPGTPDDGGHHERGNWELVAVKMSTIPAKKIIWLWQWRIAIGKLTTFAGLPDTNKSTTALDLAARVSRGDVLPAGEGQAPLGNVIILSSEDDPADTIRPRLEVMGADLERIHFITMVKEKGGKGKRGFDLTQDIERLERLIQEIGNVVLIIVDPMSAYMGKPGKLDSYRTSDVRAVLSPLGEMAGRCGVAIVGVDHLNKTAGLKALLRIAGSIAFAAAPRSLIIFVRDEEEADRRLFLPAKNNNAPEEFKKGLAFRIVKRVAPAPVSEVMPAIQWENEPIHITADEALAAASMKADGRKSETAEAWKHFLQEMLRDGPRMLVDIAAEAKRRGLDPTSKSQRTAKEKLNIWSVKKGAGGWEWGLPGQQQEDIPF